MSFLDKIFDIKDEKEIDESIVRTLYHFIYEITVYNIKTIQFILNNKEKHTHKANK